MRSASSIALRAHRREIDLSIFFAAFTILACWGQDATFSDPWAIITAYWVDTGLKLVQKNQSRSRCI